MRIHLRTLIGLRVRTVSGTSLGRIVSGEVDAETHQILSYTVRHTLWRTSASLIHIRHVLSVSSEEMVVEDTAIRTESQIAQPSSQPLPRSPSISYSTQEAIDE